MVEHQPQIVASERWVVASRPIFTRFTVAVDKIFDINLILF